MTTTRSLWIVAIVLLAIAMAGAPCWPSTAQDSRYRNIQVLKGLSDEAILESMQTWARELGVTCVHCHVQGDFASESMAPKQTARQMVQMINTLNETEVFKNGSRKARCFMCHRGSARIPEV